MSLNDLISEATKSGHPVILELGCGPNRRHKNSITIDLLSYPGVDIVGDVLSCLLAAPDASVDLITSSHFFEHVEDTSSLMTQIVRVLKVGGELEITVPHFSNPYFYSDPTHRQTYGLYSFSYLVQDPILKRRVPTYGSIMPMRLVDIQLGFKASPPFYFRHIFRKLLGFVVNISTYTKELYEDSLCYMFPCYEITFRIIRTCPS